MIFLIRMKCKLYFTWIRILASRRLKASAQILLTATCQSKDSRTTLYRMPAVLVLSACLCHRLYPVLIPGVTSRGPSPVPGLCSSAERANASFVPSSLARSSFVCCSDLLLVGEWWRRWSLLRAERFRSCFCWCYFRCKCTGELTNRCRTPWLPLLLHQQQQQ